MATDKPNSIPTWEEVNYAIRESATFDVMNFSIYEEDNPDVKTDCVSLLNAVHGNIADYVKQINKPYYGLLKVTYYPEEFNISSSVYWFTLCVKFMIKGEGKMINYASAMYFLGDAIENYGGKKYTFNISNSKWIDINE